MNKLAAVVQTLSLLGGKGCDLEYMHEQTHL